MAGPDLRQHHRGEAGSVSPLSAWRIVEALHEAGIPKGVVNFVAGSGASWRGAGEGEAGEGDLFYRFERRRQLVHLRRASAECAFQLEMGGKNPTIVLATRN